MRSRSQNCSKIAREHYLDGALQAQAEGDSLMSADEFEEAIKHC
jgi:hypothetical protein